MTLVCCTLTQNFAVMTGDTLVTLNNKFVGTVKKIFQTEDLLVGASGSAGVKDVLPVIMSTYKKGEAYSHLQNFADLFKEADEKVPEDRYTQILYVSKQDQKPFMGIIDTNGDHQIKVLQSHETFFYFQGIGEPDMPLYNSILSRLGEPKNIEEVKKLHHEYIRGVERNSKTVNNIVNHEVLFF